MTMMLTPTKVTLKPTPITNDMAKRDASDVVLVRLAHVMEVHGTTKNWREAGRR